MDEPKSEKTFNEYEGNILDSGVSLDPEFIDPLSIDKGHEDLGSLEPTDSNPEKRKIGLKTKIGVGLAAAALLLGGGSVAAKKAMNQNRPQTTGSVPTNPSPATSAEATPSVTATPELNPDAYATQMEQYAKMDISTFESLPREKRLAYAQYLIDKNVFHKVYSAAYGEYSGANQEYRITPVPASLDNTAQEIVDNQTFTFQEAYLQLQVPANTPTFDLTKGREVLSAIYYDVGDGRLVTNDYLANVKVMGTETRPTQSQDKNTAISASGLQTGTNEQGQQVQYKIITYKTKDGMTVYDRDVYTTFTSYDGTEKSVWLIDAQEIDKKHGGNGIEGLKNFGTVK